jgi:hypothetical protein
MHNDITFQICNGSSSKQMKTHDNFCKYIWYQRKQNDNITLCLNLIELLMIYEYEVVKSTRD